MKNYQVGNELIILLADGEESDTARESLAVVHIDLSHRCAQMPQLVVQWCSTVRHWCTFSRTFGVKRNDITSRFR